MGAINTIDLPETFFKSYINKEGKLIQKIRNLAGINIFVGANNSGKSRFIRLLSNVESYGVLLNDFDINKCNEQITKSCNEIKNILRKSDLRMINNLDAEKLDAFFPLPDSLNANEKIYTKIKNDFNTYSQFQSVSTQGTISSSGLGNVSSEVIGIVFSVIRTESKLVLDEIARIPSIAQFSKPKKFISQFLGDLHQSRMVIPIIFPNQL
ncbi:hypothetical protein SDC9_58985 [bioreactor metagenome]|uniref:Uncharacterized protein n=1 Tax=bioreactor metagenome TaxID=1076179 RepID=A0A644X9Z6_9ZZZZ